MGCAPFLFRACRMSSVVNLPRRVSWLGRTRAKRDSAHMNARGFRQLAKLFLVLVLSLTSITMAVARTQAQAGVTVTLCTQAGPELVILGADGSPLARPHPCPYCIIAAAVLPQAGAVFARREPVARPVRLDRAVPVIRATLDARLPEARAPPVLSV